jgi:hypothetical protein
MTTKNGRKPLQPATSDTKPRGNFFSQDILQIDPALKAEIEGKGLEYRWIDRQEFLGAGNFHKNYWSPYRRDAAKDSATMDLKYGNDPEGFIRRKSLVLAVRPKDIGDDHRITLREKASRYHGGVRKRQAEQMRQTVRESGVSASVIDDDEDN